MKWHNSDYKRISIVLLGIIATITIIDLLDLPSRLGIPVNHINNSVTSWGANILTAFIVFSLSYYLIEKWNLRSNDNKREIAKLFLKRTYNSCKSNLQILHGGTIPILVNKTDFNAYYNRNSPADRYSDISFENEEVIMAYAKEGFITSEEIDTYLEIKAHYKQHVSLCVTFFDNQKMVQPTKADLEEELDKALQELI